MSDNNYGESASQEDDTCGNCGLVLDDCECAPGQDYDYPTAADDDQEDYGAGHTGTFEVPAAAAPAAADVDNPLCAECSPQGHVEEQAYYAWAEEVGADDAS